MKITPLLLAGSLVLNAALVALLVGGAYESSAPPPASAAAIHTAGTVRKAPAPPGPETWAALQSDDIAALRDRLRAEGFPPSLVRAILAAQIRERFAARRKALDAAQADAPFWKPATPDPKLQAEMRQISKEEQKALRDLLGVDPDNGLMASLRRQLPSLPEDKLEQLAAIRERYDEMRQKFYESMRSTGGLISFTPDERAQMMNLDKAMHAEFATVLTPQELEDYDLRTSNTANQLRYELTAFDATEAEFRALYKLRSAFDEQWQLTGAPSQEQMRARGEAQKQLNDDIKAVLGDARYADYQRATDYYYRQTTQLVARLELPADAANQVYAVQKDIQGRLPGLYQDRALASADRTAQLAALAAEAQTRVTAVLGPRGFEAYKQYGGSWMQSLQPRPAPVAGGSISTSTVIRVAPSPPR